MLALLATLLYGAHALMRARSAAKSDSPAPKAVPVVVASVERKPVDSTFDVVATVQAINTVTVHARVDGIIERVLFREGARVRRGDVLAVLDRRPFILQHKAAEAQRLRDMAQADNLQRDLARYEFLVKSDSAPAQTLDATRAQLAQARAAVAGDDAQVEQARLQLSYATITAPIDGRAGARLLDAGNVVHASDAAGLVVLSQLDPAIVSFAIPQSMLAQVRRRGQAGNLQVEARDAAGVNVLARGNLSFIDSQVDPVTATVRCKATFSNGGEALWPGTFVTAHLILGTMISAVVPASAIQNGPHPYVYVLSPMNKVAARTVTIASSNGRDTAVSGVDAGEKVVVDGQFRLEDGATVNVQPNVTAGSAPASQRGTVQ